MKTKKKKLISQMWKCRQYYLMILPAILCVLIFSYGPMYGLQVAFRDYKIVLGMSGSKWIGFTHFEDLFSGYYFPILIRNTLLISIYSLLVGFPFPIIVALILHELGNGKFKRVTQTILYAPHFLSTVVLVGIINTLFAYSTGVINAILNMIGLESVYFLTQPGIFRHLYVWSGVWQGMGWNAIIYLAALAGVDPSLYEAADIDGATRMQKIININIPTIAPTIIIMLILQVGSIANVGYEKIFLLQNELNAEASEVISTYVYRRGLIDQNYGFSTAVGLFNNVVNIILLMIANAISRKFSETSLF